MKQVMRRIMDRHHDTMRDLVADFSQSKDADRFSAFEERWMKVAEVATQEKCDEMR
ncbi:hypothetical protein [Jannaschia sp. 2305UL9-9]|uniref:hypothetical protein n=1 Tax=Jannaschia sp. 2305UL9-9 TaxID=3121638 RepID=UPI003528F431